MCRARLVLLCAALAVLALPSAASAATTPELIDRAVARGEIGREAGLRYLARAFTGDEEIPAAYRSAERWDGTLPLRRLGRQVGRMRSDGARAEVRAALATTYDCGDETATLPLLRTTARFSIRYPSGALGGGLTIDDYAAALDESWRKEIVEFGWPAPPLSGTRYPVRIDQLDPSLYGYVTNFGDDAGEVGDNPNTPWREEAASATCMVLNASMPGNPPLAGLRATAAHEFAHSIQYGIGVLDGRHDPDDNFVEGGATWMEDEVFDDADDNHAYLWPRLTDSMGAYWRWADGTEPVGSPSPYASWIVFRGLTERFGTGVAGGGEDVMQRFWENVSRGSSANLAAMDAALAAEGVTLGRAYHHFAVATRFQRPCGATLLPFCFEEALDYPAATLGDETTAAIAAAGGQQSASVQDNYAARFIPLPPAGPYGVELANQGGGAAELRMTVGCGAGLVVRRAPLTAPVAAGGTATVGRFDPSGCGAPFAVVTSSSRESADPAIPNATIPFRVRVVPAGAADLAPLTVGRSGTGAGTISSAPAGIACGATCSASFAAGETVTLSATPDAASAFAGWSGPCAGTATCVVAVDEATSVTAAFDARPPADPPGDEPPSPTPTPTPVATATPAPTATVTPAPTPVAPQPAARDTTRPTLALAVAGRVKGGRLRLRVACPATERSGCTGRVTLEARLGGRTVRLGTATVRALRGGQARTVTVRLRASAARKLRRARRAIVTASVRVTDGAGNANRQTKRLKVRA